AVPRRGLAMSHPGSWLERFRRDAARARRRCHRRLLELVVLEDRTTPVGTGTGLYSQYYTDQTFSLLALTRLDPAINFTWSNVPPGPGMGKTNYSIRWTGQLEALNTGPTMIYTKSDDGVRLIIDGKTVIDNWSDHTLTENATKINLVAGHKYLIELD